MIVDTILDKSTRLDDLSRGRAESKNLSEILKIDFSTLLPSIAPDMPVIDFGKAGISAKMAIAGAALQRHLGREGLVAFQTHKSDMVRGLAIYGLANELETESVEAALETVRPFAGDLHFGVREWAWLAVRPRLVRELTKSISVLAAWTEDKNPLIRRFAVEALRPRGVWCKSIPELRQDPSIGLPLLEPMYLESEKYPQDSVANWLNDASKDNPDWVKALCRSWIEKSAGAKSTARIVTRATRSL